jgi:hypothetical protein
MERVISNKEIAQIQIYTPEKIAENISLREALIVMIKKLFK